MSRHSVRFALGCVVASLALSATAPRAASAEIIGKVPGAQSAAGMTYVSLAEACDRIAMRTRMRHEASAYWRAIAEMRNVRATKRRNNELVLITDYVLSQPPNLSSLASRYGSDEPETVGSSWPAIPVAADFLKSAATHFDFVPLKPQRETDYKQMYAKTATGGGLSWQQAVRIYAFESGGNGTYDVQAGLEYPIPGARAISTALGYNQLLAANSIELFVDHGDRIIDMLADKSLQLPEEARGPIEAKIQVVKRMVAFARSVPNEWDDHMRLAGTPKGLAIHAMILDLDVGPALQALKLVNALNFAIKKGYYETLSAAELEMMNLTGDANGLDMVMLPQALRERVPTANFFQRGGYERNSVAVRNNTVSKLLAATDAKMDEEINLRGAIELASYF